VLSFSSPESDIFINFVLNFWEKVFFCIIEREIICVKKKKSKMFLECKFLSALLLMVVGTIEEIECLYSCASANLEIMSGMFVTNYLKLRLHTTINRADFMFCRMLSIDDVVR
jgi:hypothetical protein